MTLVQNFISIIKLEKAGCWCFSSVPLKSMKPLTLAVDISNRLLMQMREIKKNLMGHSDSEKACRQLLKSGCTVLVNMQISWVSVTMCYSWKENTKWTLLEGCKREFQSFWQYQSYRYNKFVLKRLLTTLAIFQPRSSLEDNRGKREKGRKLTTRGGERKKRERRKEERKWGGHHGYLLLIHVRMDDEVNELKRQWLKATGWRGEIRFSFLASWLWLK